VKPVFMSERWYWLDWLRVLAMGTIFLFHSSRPFDVYSPWHITNSTPDLGFTLFDSFISGWIMPLFFVISGIAVYFSLSRRSASEFATDRLERLIVPFIFGLFFILPVNVYYDAVFHGNYVGDLGSFYLGPYFTKWFPFTMNFSPTYFAHSDQGVYLWYLFWLFIFSIATVYIFKWLVREGSLNMLSKLHAVCNRRGGLLLLAVPVVLVNIAAVSPFFVFPSGYGGWKLPTYLILFVIAYVMATNPRLAEAVEKNRVPALLLGVLTSLLILGVTALTAGQSAAGGSASGNGIDAYYVVVSTVWALNGWCWVAAILGFGRKHLSFNHKYLKISNELVLPFYVLHQSVIVAVAFYIVGLDLISIEKFLLIVLVSFPTIAVLLYPINKINVLRFLFGMRMKNRSP
jgi:glucan biosynthesis protein C